MANARAAQNEQLFQQAAAIYGQMGMGVPNFTGKGGGGRRTSFLQNAINQGQTMLAQYRQRQLQQQMMTAQMAQASRMAALLKPKSQPNTLKSTLASGDAGVRSRRSRTQQVAMEQGVRASNQLQAGPYMGPQGGQSASPYGSSINLA